MILEPIAKALVALARPAADALHRRALKRMDQRIARLAFAVCQEFSAGRIQLGLEANRVRLRARWERDMFHMEHLLRWHPIPEPKLHVRPVQAVRKERADG